MYQHQFRMDNGKSARHFIKRIETARREFTKRALLQLGHKPRDLSGGGKGKISLAYVHSAVPAGPGIDRPKPDIVNLPHVSSSEAVGFVINSHQLFKRAKLLASLELIHLPLALDAGQISKHPTTRAWLELSLRQFRDIIPSNLLQPTSSFASTKNDHEPRTRHFPYHEHVPNLLRQAFRGFS